MTQSKIEWTGRSDWNPVRGCTRVTEACRNCYAEIMAARFSKPGMWGHSFAEIVKIRDGIDHRWTGKVELIEERLTLPLRWRKPGFVFPNSTSDFFHESLPDSDIDKLFAVMSLCPHLTFQILTKRWERMREYTNASGWGRRVVDAALALVKQGLIPEKMVGADVEVKWPLQNVWLGVSVHDQASANEAIPALLATHTGFRFASYEPALGPVDWTSIDLAGARHVFLNSLSGREWDDLGDRTFHKPLDWIIAGGESGNGARPAHPDWFRNTRDQCATAETPFFFKQWGEWAADTELLELSYAKHYRDTHYIDRDTVEQRKNRQRFSDSCMTRLGKAKTGNLLDGHQYLELPGHSHA